MGSTAVGGESDVFVFFWLFGVAGECWGHQST